MKKVKESSLIHDLKVEIIQHDINIARVNRNILYQKRGAKLLQLIVLDRRLKKERQQMVIKLHTLENKIIDMGRSRGYTLYPIAQKNTNQYSN